MTGIKTLQNYSRKVTKVKNNKYNKPQQTVKVTEKDFHTWPHYIVVDVHVSKEIVRNAKKQKNVTHTKEKNNQTKVSLRKPRHWTY